MHGSVPDNDECIRADAGLPCTPARVDHHPVTIFWDSCSTHAIAGTDLRHTGKPAHSKSFPTKCEGFIAGTLHPVETVREIQVTFPGSHVLPLNVLILKGRPPGTILIGTDTYWDNGIEINFQHAFIKWTVAEVNPLCVLDQSDLARFC